MNYRKTSNAEVKSEAAFLSTISGQIFMER